MIQISRWSSTQLRRPLPAFAGRLFLRHLGRLPPPLCILGDFYLRQLDHLVYDLLLREVRQLSCAILLVLGLCLLDGVDHVFVLGVRSGEQVEG